MPPQQYTGEPGSEVEFIFTSPNIITLNAENP